ncbi:MAG: M20/M25/M40 family metallo-hydrolase [Proteobacteria bacterium]|nr:M20/M25/M40 family metallo-hydrolase [Pseudomonadota bacterium]
MKKSPKKWPRIFIRIVAIIVAVLVLTAIGLSVRALLTRFPAVAPWTDNAAAIPPDSDRRAQILAGGIRIPTVSGADSALFSEFREYLKTSYPRVFGAMEYNLVGEQSVLLRWPGENPKLGPILFGAHYDVVPAGDAKAWQHPAFSGAVADGRIWGRGAIDDKGMLFSLMNSAESLIKSGFRPERDIYFVFNADEETENKGAANVAEYLAARGLRFDAIYDEGSFIILNDMNGVRSGIALVGVAEKGFMTVRITVRGPAGHSSMPPMRTAVNDAAIIMRRLTDNQMPARILPETDGLLRAGASGFPEKFVVANRDVPIIKQAFQNKLSADPTMNAMIRTTTAIAGMTAGDPNVDNVIPGSAEIIVNFRLQPGDTIADVLHHVKEQLRGYDADVAVLNGWDASAVSPTAARGFQKLSESIRAVYPAATVVPYITPGGTDSRRYQELCDKIYRIVPVPTTAGDREGMHGINESISVSGLAGMDSYFEYLMKNYDRD